jgi:hypothetical protein
MCGRKVAFLIAKTLYNLDLICGFNYIKLIIARERRNIMRRFYRSFGQNIEKFGKLGDSKGRLTQNAKPVFI